MFNVWDSSFIRYGIKEIEPYIEIRLKLKEWYFNKEGKRVNLPEK